jgi:peptidoglycan/LPS O-acetylase OafA/YrhL
MQIDSAATDAGAPRLGYRPALDGLRALAIAMVLWHHSVALLFGDADGLPLGGFVGVDVFFVLSGFLITTLLMERRGQPFGRALRRFYSRRAARLLPALVVFLTVHAVVAVALGRDLATEARTTFVALAYLSNWASTFDWHLAGDQIHLWSLAIEEQFYLVWPLLLALLTSRTRRPRTTVAVIAVGVAVVALWRLVLVTRLGTAYPEVYERTDTHMDGLLIGAGLSIVWAAGWRPTRRVAGFAGLAGFGALAVAFFKANALGDAVYRYGFTLVGVASAAIIVAALTEGSMVERLLRRRPLVHVGRLSYSMYLWHTVVFALAAQLLPGATPTRLLAAYGVTGACALISYRFVERPFLVPTDRTRPAVAPSGLPSHRRRAWGPGTAPVLGGAIAVSFLVGAGASAATAVRGMEPPNRVATAPPVDGGSTEGFTDAGPSATTATTAVEPGEGPATTEGGPSAPDGTRVRPTTLTLDAPRLSAPPVGTPEVRMTLQALLTVDPGDVPPPVDIVLVVRSAATGEVSCTAATDATGVASCEVVAPLALATSGAPVTLVGTFAGTPSLAPSSAQTPVPTPTTVAAPPPTV